MKLNRELQLNLLNKLQAEYPRSLDIQQMARENPEFAANIAYLSEHGLLRGQTFATITDGTRYINATITAAGLDFLADDGGLTAILGVVTIKLHEADLLALIASRIEESGASEAEKKSWKDGLKALPAEAIKHLTMKLVDSGLANWSEAFHTIQKALAGHL